MIDQTKMTRSFFETLHPLLSRLNAERTLSPGKLGVLRYLSEHGRATTSELALAGRVSPQGISLAARELERLQLVTRVPDNVDRRRVWIELTDEGSRKFTQEVSAGYSWLDRTVRERLTPEDFKALEAVIPVLSKLASEATSG
ncbi:MarR family winged helix-turn-helix transcriptional regulator [Arthrobacter sp. ISL-65]|jgi:DNA-binding MarR family transcriptional regulator|uniref:MarR family winged helix-turn-helix transcriptional regulator n=1 Tax=Arthrobacter sp. ISL-65 TaxID=2819112 RepID=UPI001BE7420D|nr:MarR family transcriptional regulator [Arthrobacter sp. ISL-65]MBT2550250.1 MarR family transcriptional regulator [Arthrobacter sp. ISL-65]